MQKSRFVGRKREMALLQEESKLGGGARLFVVSGRRRIGKTRFIKEFAKLENKRFLDFTGRSPDRGGETEQIQIAEFMRKAAKYVGVKPKSTDLFWPYDSWFSVLHFLSDHLTDEPTVIMLDEISWMSIEKFDKGSTTYSHLISSLKSWWDTEIHHKRPNVVMFFSGSVSTWIDENIIKSTAFFGRIIRQINLEPLQLNESLEMLKDIGMVGSLYEQLKLVMILGGIPWHLEMVNPQLSAASNIQRLCFSASGLLVEEFDSLFHDLFNGHGELYHKILSFLSDESNCSVERVAKGIGWQDSLKNLAKALQQLKIAGFVRECYQWSIVKKATYLEDENSLYRLSDCYSRFYLKFIAPLRKDIADGLIEQQDLNMVVPEGWAAIMGLQMESLLIQNWRLLHKALRLVPGSVIKSNPYSQKATLSQEGAEMATKGCQIDYLIQTRGMELYVCEFKFNCEPLSVQVVAQVKDKIAKLDHARGYTTIPVLICFGGVSDAVVKAGYFAHIVHMDELCSIEG